MLMLLPGAMYFWVLFIGQGPLQEVLQEQERHILPRILAAPVTLSQFVLAKMLRCFILCSLALALLIVASALLFGIHWGNPFALALALAACAFSMTGLLSFTYSLARTREQANVMSSAVLLLFAMVGGSMFPFESLPKFLQMVGQFSPNRWGVLALRGVAAAKPMAALLHPLLGLLALGALGTTLAFFLFGRQLSQGRSK